MNINLVQFSNGRYGIRRNGKFYDDYLDFVEAEVTGLIGELKWRTKSDPKFPDCMSDLPGARFKFSTLKEHVLFDYKHIKDEVIE